MSGGQMSSEPWGGYAPSSWMAMLQKLGDSPDNREDILEAILSQVTADAAYLFDDAVLPFIAYIRDIDPRLWLGHVLPLITFWKKADKQRFETVLDEKRLSSAQQDTRHGHNGRQPGEMPAPPPAATWEADLLVSKQGVPTENVSNICLILAHHPAWHGAFWWDSVRMLPMLHGEPLTDAQIVAIGQWLGTAMRMPIRSLRLLERCILQVCLHSPRDLLREWLHSLPRWDGIERLNTWLSDVAGTPCDAYGMDISRLLPVSMVARALDPGCQYRYVIILEGAEDAGKSKLVRTLASPAWYVELTKGLDSKEAHMILQGAWVAEFAELDSLSRTEETKLKAFITHQEDIWVPKFSNLKTTSKRRTIFIGTTNEQSYLKGQTGNTRFLPIKTTDHPLRCDLLEANREQLFAEALVYYGAHPDTWWHLSSDGMKEAKAQRELRRQFSVYEDTLGEWLDKTRFAMQVFEGNESVTFTTNETSWSEIAKYFLLLDTVEKWKDKALQMQIAQALGALGWENTVIWREGRSIRRWVKKEQPDAK
jgi:hypothetical protein